MLTDCTNDDGNLWFGRADSRGLHCQPRRQHIKIRSSLTRLTDMKPSKASHNEERASQAHDGNPYRSALLQRRTGESLIAAVSSVKK